MRNLLVVCALAVVLVAATSVMAQPQWSIGPKGGLTISSVYGDDSEGSSAKLGFAFGGFVMAALNDNFGIQTEVSWVRKGLTVDAGLVEIDWNLDYVEIPLLLVGMLPTGDLSKIMFYGGPAFAFNVGSDIEGIDAGDVTKGSDFGLAVGSGAIFDVGTVGILIDGRVTFGLTSWADEPTTDPDIKNYAFQFTAGVSVPLGGN